MKNYTYLAGPMEDCTLDHMTKWRDTAAAQLEMAGIKSLDPTRRVQEHNQMVEQKELGDSRELCKNLANRIFKMDLQDIANSSVILADCRKSSGRGTGTSMELMFAHMKNKIIILWVDPEDRLHPFYEAMYTEKHYTLEDALDAVTYYYDGEI